MAPPFESSQTVVEEFEAGGFWSCRDLNKWLLIIVTLAFGIALGADVIYELVYSDQAPVGLAVAGIISIGCIMLLWVNVTYAVATGLGMLIVALFVDGVVYSVLLALLLAGLAAQNTTKPFRRVGLGLLVLWGAGLGVTIDDAALGSLTFLGMTAGLLAAYGLGSSFRHATDESLQSTRDLEEIQQRHEQAKAAERKSIARDLHDIVAHDITIIAMQSRAAQLRDTDSAYREAVRVIGDSSRAALNDLRRMLDLLKTEKILDDAAAPISNASELEIRSGTEIFAERLESLGITVHRELSGDVDQLSRSVGAALYRMLQECTTNVAKYAGQGAACWIEIEVGGEHVAMCVTNTVQDSYRGGPDFSATGTGLIGVRDRAEAFGGTAQAGYNDQGQWEVRVSGMKRS
ncbi:sensor histidine kinase [Nesterenkonia ebinurensis]|uniref:sensor histidine kinase n=1 Tax=Nesterenkonia ebinurensis TaxID=2608252 RepID=UPI00123C9819|nr:histidine kinase [Nesterenkonia ebinurensis]